MLKSETEWSSAIDWVTKNKFKGDTKFDGSVNNMYTIFKENSLPNKTPKISLFMQNNEKCSTNDFTLLYKKNLFMVLTILTSI